MADEKKTKKIFVPGIQTEDLTLDVQPEAKPVTIKSVHPLPHVTKHIVPETKAVDPNLTIGANDPRPTKTQLRKRSGYKV